MPSPDLTTDLTTDAENVTHLIITAGDALEAAWHAAASLLNDRTLDADRNDLNDLLNKMITLAATTTAKIEPYQASPFPLISDASRQMAKCITHATTAYSTLATTLVAAAPIQTDDPNTIPSNIADAVQVIESARSTFLTLGSAWLAALLDVLPTLTAEKLVAQIKDPTPLDALSLGSAPYYPN